MRKLLLLCIALAMVISGLAMIRQKETVLSHGTPVLLRLAPVDPRSLMQGDYMALNYAASVQAGKALKDPRSSPQDGHLILLRAADGTCSFVRLDDGRALDTNEIRLRYRQRGDMVRLGAESFLFQEGDNKKYAKAHYGELRVDPSGESVLVGLRDEGLQPLGLEP